MLTEYGENADGVVVQAGLRGKPEPAYGTLLSATGWKAAPGPHGEPDQAVELNGTDGMLVYQLRSVSGGRVHACRCGSRLSVSPVPWGRCSAPGAAAWMIRCASACTKGKLYCAIEAGAGYSTSGMPIAKDTWYDVCVVRRSSELTLFVDGKLVETIRVPAIVQSAARDFALGAIRTSRAAANTCPAAWPTCVLSTPAIVAGRGGRTAREPREMKGLVEPRPPRRYA